MKTTTAFMLCVAFILASDRSKIVEAITVSPVNPINATETSTSTSASISTTAVNNKTSTTSTTTPASTTSTDTTTSTTTTTTSSPVTTTKATPPVEPSARTWNYTQGNDTVIVKMSAQLHIKYNNTDNKTVPYILNVPSDNETAVTGNLTPAIQTLDLSWNSTSNSTNKNKLTFSFVNYTKTYALESIKLTLSDLPQTAPNVTLEVTYKPQNFNITLGESYRCTKSQQFDLKTSDSKDSGYIEVKDLQVQAFKTDKTEGFSTAIDCVPDIPDAVPIVVGCVLAGLVVIVLAVYLISRRRSQARGYLSM